MNKLLVLSLMTIGTLLFFIPADAQTKRFSSHDSYDDISAGFGWMIPMVQGDLGSDCNEGKMLRLDYRHFYENRAGFGIGAQHVRNYMDEYVDNPLAQGFMSDVAAFLLGMVNRAEFAHIFPGIADLTCI